MSGCRSFERWLDHGRPDDPAMESHAASCARCAARLATDRALDARLDAIVVAAPADLTDAVMRRVEVARRVSPMGTLLPAALPWWVRAAAQPATACAALLGALMLWKGAALVTPASAALANLSHVVRIPRGAPLPDAFATWLLPALVGVGCWGLFRWAERATRRLASPVVPRSAPNAGGTRGH